MRNKVLILILSLMISFYVSTAMSLDLGRALRKAAGHALNEAIQGGVTPAPQYETSSSDYPYQQGQTYTYEEYLASQGTVDADFVNESEPTGTFIGMDDGISQETAAAKQDDGFDPENPFAGLVDMDDEPSTANAGAGGQAEGKDGDTIEVVATGIGQDSDQALKNALRAAIEQAVGTLVDSETLAQNDEVMNDQILSYSAGFVQSHKVIGEPRTRDGLVTIRIQAQVKRTQLTEKLKAANIHIKEVDGESLFGEVFTALEQEQNAVDMLKKKFDGFPENMLEIKLAGKPKYNNESKKIQIEVELSINRERYRAFAKELIDLLSKFASSHQTINQNVQPHNNSISISLLNQARGMIAICTQMNDARTNSKWEIYSISKEILAGREHYLFGLS